MAKQMKLAARLRKAAGGSAAKAVRAQGYVPAVIYGAKQAAENLEVAEKELSQLLSRTTNEHVLVDLEIARDGKPVNRMAIIKDVQHDPVKRVVLHVDFHAVSQNESFEAEVPVEATGEADGVKTYGGIFQQSLRTIEIECLPKDLPEVIRADVSALQIGEAVHVRDLVVPEGVTVLTDPDLTVFLVAEPTVSEASDSTEGPTQPEVIKEKKQDPDSDKK